MNIIEKIKKDLRDVEFLNQSHIYKTPQEAFVKFFLELFIMMATVYCYYKVDEKSSIIATATLTYALSYADKAISCMNQNETWLHKCYIICFIIWVAIILGLSSYKIFRGSGVSKNINDELVYWCFFPLAIEFLDALLLYLGPHDKKKASEGRIPEYRLKEI